MRNPVTDVFAQKPPQFNVKFKMVFTALDQHVKKKKKKSEEFSYGTQLLAFDPSQLRFGNIPPAFIVFA
jgi:hypothetical protein